MLASPRRPALRAHRRCPLAVVIACLLPEPSVASASDFQSALRVTPLLAEVGTPVEVAYDHGCHSPCGPTPALDVTEVQGNRIVHRLDRKPPKIPAGGPCPEYCLPVRWTATVTPVRAGVYEGTVLLEGTVVARYTLRAFDDSRGAAEAIEHHLAGVARGLLGWEAEMVIRTAMARREGEIVSALIPVAREVLTRHQGTDLRYAVLDWLKQEKTKQALRALGPELSGAWDILEPIATDADLSAALARLRCEYDAYDALFRAILGGRRHRLCKVVARARSRLQACGGARWDTYFAALLDMRSASCDAAVKAWLDSPEPDYTLLRFIGKRASDSPFKVIVARRAKTWRKAARRADSDGRYQIGFRPAIVEAAISQAR